MMCWLAMREISLSILLLLATRRRPRQWPGARTCGNVQKGTRTGRDQDHGEEPPPVLSGRNSWKRTVLNVKMTM